jgi:DNA-binding transcriptional ArsR family regulator
MVMTKESKTPHPMLTNRDLIRHKNYNIILTLCAEKPCCANDVSEVSNMSLPTTRNHFATLKDSGYLISEKGIYGKTNRTTNFYTSIKTEYLLEDLIPTGVKVRNSRAENKLNPPSEQVEEEVNPNVTTFNIDKKDEAPSHIRNIKERHVASTRKFESRGIGSSMGMV